MATGSLIGGAIYQNYGGVFLFRFGLSQCGGLEWHNDKIPCKRAILGPRGPLKLPLVSVVVPSFLTPPHPLSHTTSPSHGHNTGCPKKMSHSDFYLKSVPEVRLYFSHVFRNKNFELKIAMGHFLGGHPVIITGPVYV